MGSISFINKKGSGGGGTPSTSSMNLFMQLNEPNKKKGIWVKSATQYENKVAVQNALGETGEYTKLTDIPTSRLYLWKCSSNRYRHIFIRWK